MSLKILSAWMVAALFHMAPGADAAAQELVEDAPGPDNPTARFWVQFFHSAGVYYLYFDSWIPYVTITAPPHPTYHSFAGNIRVLPRRGGSSKTWQILAFDLVYQDGETTCRSYVHLKGVGTSTGYQWFGPPVSETGSSEGIRASVTRHGRGVRGTVVGSATLPLITSPYIDYVYHFYLQVVRRSWGDYLFFWLGTPPLSPFQHSSIHDGFPSYSVYSRGKRAYFHDCRRQTGYSLIGEGWLEALLGETNPPQRTPYRGWPAQYPTDPVLYYSASRSHVWPIQ